MSGWDAYISVLAERHARNFEQQMLAEIVKAPDSSYAPNDALTNNHTTTGKSWIDAELAKHKNTGPFKPSLNHKVSIMDCTP
jgi:hypothetical protein